MAQYKTIYILNVYTTGTNISVARIEIQLPLKARMDLSTYHILRKHSQI